MTTERTLVVDLDKRINNSPRFQDGSVREYFRNSKLEWWKPTEPAYINQELLIADWLKGKHFQNGLELGPGFGRITNLIAPCVENLTLVEINKRAVKKLTAQFPTARILNKAVENFDDWKGNYSLIVAVEILVHIPDLSSLISRVSNSLDRGGVFITSITPDNFYNGKRTIIHRGINKEEFEKALYQNKLMIAQKVQNDHVLTYSLVKPQ